MAFQFNQRKAARSSQLHFRKQDNEDLVRTVLGETESSAANEAKACLIIVYRYRNNLFHGIKWREELRGQLENFNTANSALERAALNMNHQDLARSDERSEDPGGAG